jgi:hypothetical protein
MPRMRSSALVLLFAIACEKSPDAAPSSPPPSDAPTTPAPTDGGDEKPGLTIAECEAQGGKVTGDIGDGAIHRPDYKCPASGEAPIGAIKTDPGRPAAIEGAVCCK